MPFAGKTVTWRFEPMSDAAISLGALCLMPVLAYLIGSLSFAVLVSRVMGLSDPRSYGSKNPGATNVLRSGNKRAALLTLFLDAAKGWLPVFLVRLFADRFTSEPGLLLAAVALAAFLGHLFPVFFKFQGGKGVATALGVLLGIDTALGLCVAAVWVGAALVWRYSSLSALLAALAAPLIYVMGDGALWQVEPPVALALSLMSALLIWRHRQNIARLVAGQESKIGQKKA